MARELVLSQTTDEDRRLVELANGAVEMRIDYPNGTRGARYYIAPDELPAVLDFLLHTRVIGGRPIGDLQRMVEPVDSIGE